jgi:GNAT superfamily N-acetyltransferase
MFRTTPAKQLIRNETFPIVHALPNVFDSMAHLEQVYPEFRSWFDGKVSAGLRDGSRRIFVKVRGGKITAVAIAKRTISERKLCTLWVDEDMRGKGFASALAEEAFDWLGIRTPLFSVPDLHSHEFRPLLSRWNFCETQVLRDLYRPNSKEYVFNGILRPLS